MAEGSKRSEKLWPKYLDIAYLSHFHYKRDDNTNTGTQVQNITTRGNVTHQCHLLYNHKELLAQKNTAIH